MKTIIDNYYGYTVEVAATTKGEPQVYAYTISRPDKGVAVSEGNFDSREQAINAALECVRDIAPESAGPQYEIIFEGSINGLGTIIIKDTFDSEGQCYGYAEEFWSEYINRDYPNFDWYYSLDEIFEIINERVQDA